MILEHPNDKHWSESELDHAWRTMPRTDQPRTPDHTTPATARSNPATTLLDIATGIGTIAAYSALVAMGFLLLAAWFDLI